MPEIREIIDNNNKVTGYTLSGKRYNSLDEARAASKAEYAATDYNSVLETTDPSAPFIRRNPWVGDALRGLLTGGSYAGGFVGGTAASGGNPFVGALTGTAAAGLGNEGYSRLQRALPDILGQERTRLTRGIEVLGEPIMHGAGSAISGLVRSSGLKQAARDAYLKYYGRSKAQNNVLNNIFEEGTTPTLDIAESIGDELSLTPSQISKSTDLLNIERDSPSFEKSRFIQSQQLGGMAERLKSDLGLKSDILTKGSEGQELRGVARSIAAKTLQGFRAQKKAIGDMLEVLSPEKQIVIPGKKFTSSFVDPSGKAIENVGPSTLLTIKAPVDIRVSQAYAKDAIKDLEKIKLNDRIADNLKKDVDPLINILQHYAQNPNFESFRRLDDVRSRIGKYAYRYSGAENTDKLKALYGRINEDIGKAMDQEPVLRRMWDDYRATSSKFIGAKESTFGKKLLAKVGEERASSESIISNSLNSTEDWLRARTLLGDQGSKELLLNEMMFSPERIAQGSKFWADEMSSFASKHLDKFKQVFTSDERNRIQRFIHSAKLANRSWGNGAAISPEKKAESSGAQLATAAITGSAAYIVRGITGLALRLTDKSLSDLMLDKTAGEALIKLARERGNTFGSDMAQRKLIKRAVELGIPLSSASSGLAVIINPATGEPIEVEPPTN